VNSILKGNPSITDSQNRLLHEKTEFDDWRSLSLGIYMALTGYAVMVGLPVIATSWVNNLGFSETQVGYVTSADLFGLAIGAVIAFFVVAKYDRRHLTIAAAGVAIAANLACIYFQSYEVTFWLRLLAGMGAGVYTGIAVATIGGHSRPAFAFGMELFAFAFSQAAELRFLPYLSIEGMYLTFAATFVAGLLFIRWLPRRPTEAALDIEVDVAEADGGHHVEHRHVPTYVPWLVLTAVVFTYINIGGYWAYIELATVGTDASPEWVGNMLVYTSFFSLVGCLVAVLLSNRYGLSRPLLVTLGFQASIVLMLVFGITNYSVAFSMFAFNFCWIFVDIYQAATIANVDRSGRFVSLLPAAQGLGNGLGPAMAASVLSWGLGYSGVFIMCASASVVAMLAYLYMYLMLRRTIPALADAS
jgi:predicted MFS family arabinose efflux permease